MHTCKKKSKNRPKIFCAYADKFAYTSVHMYILYIYIHICIYILNIHLSIFMNLYIFINSYIYKYIYIWLTEINKFQHENPIQALWR